MATVKVIPSKPKVTQVAPKQQAIVERLRVAAYCRVSTDHEDQESSYEAQCTHYEDYINKNPEWELAGIYADEGISGLAANKRPEFKRLIEDCMSGKVQMVITKSISRFARNTLDCLQYIRKLKAKGVPIMFEKENILTTDAKGEILITIMASIAQQESASISQNVQMGVRYHYQQGKVGAGHQRFLGYERTPDASLRIVPEEAKIVRRIFREFIEGDSPNLIAKRLTGEHVCWRFNTEGKWVGGSIKYLLQNEKYTGTLLLQKYYTVDFLTKKIARNRGEVPQYLVENSHPPIVPKEVFLQAQGEMARRAVIFENSFKSSGEREPMLSNEMALSGRLICGVCGRAFRRKKEGKKIMWRCGTNIEKKWKDEHCDNGAIEERVIQGVIIEAMNRLPEEEINLVRLEERIICGVIQPIDRDLEITSQRMEAGEKLNEQHQELVLRRVEYAKKRLEIYKLLERISLLKNESLGGEDNGEACAELEDFLKRTRIKTESGSITEFKDSEILRYVEKTVVHPDKIEVVFKAGVSIEVKA